ncbi:helix-turn-helix domain-containing protein [Aquiflexum sp. LQ15W]|uniref:helix-turn-helix domain-containing protein n=1 Tax=Cognataquiflexum nitidum TaxID=2922272 RepID=UPI001F133E97|nr:AraC family transcriptional regulator [Cognataquiflexum nitidum]MCH6198941.1 helix-turn-helix domain-containing protein [Cognataquiflexum nitidum]
MEPKLFDLRHFLLTFLLIGNTCHFTFGQSGQPFKDQQLEENLQKNQLSEAEKLIEVQLAQEDQLSLEQRVYFLNRLSQLSLTKGDFKQALTEAKKASEALMEIPESSLWGETNRVLCFAYIRNGKLDSALIFAEKLYDFTKTNGDQALKRAALLAMGNISLQNKSYQKSLEFYTDALQITENIQDSINLKVDYYNVGLALSQLNEHQKSNTYLLKAAELAEKENFWDLAARSYGTMADNFLDLNNTESQETYLKKANEIAAKIGNTQLLSMGYSNLTETALRKGDFKQAVVYGNQSLEFMANRPIIQLQAKVDSMLYVAHKNLGNFKEALNKLEDYDQKRLSIRNEEQKGQLDKLTIEFEVEKKDLLIANQEALIGEERAKNQAFLIGIALLGSLAFFSVYINLKNSKTRKLLFRKEKELDQVVKLKSPVQVPLPKFEVTEEEETGKGSENDYTLLFNEILEYIQVNKLYLDPKLNQQTLVSEFGTNRKYLYEAISQNGDDNFRGVINRFRINEAKAQMEQQIKNGETVDFAILAEKVGFNSYTTFYRAFKSFTGLTPGEFSKELIQDIRENNRKNE